MAKKNIWKTIGLIGIGYAAHDYYSKRQFQVKYDPGFKNREKIRDIVLNAIVRKFDNILYPDNSQKHYQRVSYADIPKVCYAQKSIKPIYNDVDFRSEKQCLEFMEAIRKLFDDQGFVTVLQYMDQAGRDIRPEQHNYGWYSLADMDYKRTRFYPGCSRWEVKMPFPVPLN